MAWFKNVREGLYGSPACGTFVIPVIVTRNLDHLSLDIARRHVVSLFGAKTRYVVGKVLFWYAGANRTGMGERGSRQAVDAA